MDHFAPHRGVSFEGYYSKFRLPSGSSLALIVSAVPGAARAARSSDEAQVHLNRQDSKPFMISFTYVSPDSSRHYQKVWLPDHFDIQTSNDKSSADPGFRISWDGGEFSWTSKPDVVSWRIDSDGIRFSAQTQAGSRVPWLPGEQHSTPAGPLARLPLPIQWHVHSVDSQCGFRFAMDNPASSLPLDERDREGEARVHTEKNWAISFPTSYIWVQARNHDTETGVCIAGGALIPGVQAYLVGYHAKDGVISFKPPTSTSIFGLSLGLHSDVSYGRGVAKIDVKGWFTRLVVTAKVENKGSYFTLAAPLKEGHREDYCAQSFGADIEVRVERRAWPWSAWTHESVERFTGGSLEFGGDFFPHE